MEQNDNARNGGGRSMEVVRMFPSVARFSADSAALNNISEEHMAVFYIGNESWGTANLNK